MSGRSMLRVGLAGAAAGLAGLGFGPVFGGFPPPFLIAIAVVTVVAVAIVMIPRVPTFVAAPAGTIAVVVAAMATTGSYADIHHGPRQLLTGSLPTEPSGAALGAIAVLVGWTVLAAGLLAGHAAQPLAPLGPVTLCLLAALGLGAAGSPLPMWYPVALLVSVVGLLLAGRTVGPSPAVAAVAATIAVVAVAVTALAGPVAPGVGARPAADVRDLVDAPVTPRSGVSPLQQFLALRNGVRPVKLTGTVSRPGSLLRMVTLTRFDGGFWTVEADYRRASTILAQPRVTATPVTVTQQITVEAGELDWIPVAGRATAISVPGLGVDESTGDLAVPVGVVPPAGYTATSAVNQADFNEVIAADPVPGVKPAAALPPQLASFLDTAVSGQPSGSDELLALYRAFTGGQFKHDQSAEAPGGHGYFHIARLLTTQRGTSEQYASAYAVFARHLGYEARVVMGFRPRYDGETFVATGSDVDAWVEVNFAGIGWIGVDPSPRGNPDGTRPNAPSASSQLSTLDDPLKAGSQTPPPGEPEPPRTEDDTTVAAPANRVTKAATITGAALILLLLLAAATPVAKTGQRMWRRRRASDRHAILGAWHDVLDRLHEAGIRTGGAHSTGDVVRLAGDVNAGLAQPAMLPALAAVADRAAYAPDTPPATLREQAWIIAADVRAQIRTTLPPPRRLAALLNPRPLLNPRRRTTH